MNTTFKLGAFLFLIYILKILLQVRILVVALAGEVGFFDAFPAPLMA
jgi:hypothetical protein